MRSQVERAAAFRALHEGPPFVVPNPWDVGSARVLEAMGFQALATTSSGFAFTLGQLDGNVTLDEVVSHVSGLTQATDLPVSVDLRTATAPLRSAPPGRSSGWRRRRAPSEARSRIGTPAATCTTRATPPSGSRPPPRRRTRSRSPSC